MKVMVTGASGFIGKALVSELLKQGRFVRAISRLPAEPAIMNINFEWFVVNDLNNHIYSSVLDGVDTVVHLAARAHVLKETVADPIAEFRRINVRITENLARAASQHGVKRFIFISSIGVNGNATGQGIFTEESPPAPHNDYAVTKWEAEQTLMRIARETAMEVVIIRPPLVYGPGVKGYFALLLKWVRRGLPLPLGAINNKRSLIALENLVNFIALCADWKKSPMAKNQVFLISDDEDVSTTKLLQKVASAYGKRAHLFPIPLSWMQFGAQALGQAAIAERLLGSLAVDSSKARNLLGWRPVISMEEQLQKLAQHDAPI